MKALNAIGRILLIVAAIMLLSSGIPSLITVINQINAKGWNTLFADLNDLSLFSSLCSAGWSCLLGGAAALSALFGRASFGLSLFALIQIGIVVWSVISLQRAGKLSDWQSILNVIVGFAGPIIYFLGAFFIRFRKSS